MQSINLQILTPEKLIFSGNIEKLVCQTPRGEIGILPGHVNLLTTLKSGSLTITQNGKDSNLAIGQGLLKIDETGAKLLTDMALEAKDIDEKVAEEARSRAQAALQDKTLSDEEYATTIAILEKSLAQLHVKHRHRSS